MRVALIHDYLIEYGGAERVLEALHEIFPEAPIYTAYLDLDGLGFHKEEIKTWNIKTSWMQNLPMARKLISPFRIFAAKTFESFDLSEYDVVISSCNTYFSKAVKIKQGALHLSYIHTPPRYLYGFTTSFNYKKHLITRILGELANHFLRLQDFTVSQRPNILIANSKNVADRIEKFYRRDSVVVYPPVEVDWIRVKSQESRVKKKDHFLSVSRLVRGKGVDVIIEACGTLGLPLKVVGTGPEYENFKFQISNFKWRNIELLGGVKDEQLPELYANAKALIVSSEDEDFGITSVEAQAAGTPVIAVAAGGYLETIVSKKTGLFFKKANTESLIAVLKEFNPKDFKAEDCQKNSEKFSKENFKKAILNLIDKKT